MAETAIDYLIREVKINSERIDILLLEVQDLERKNDKLLEKIFKESR